MRQQGQRNSNQTAQAPTFVDLGLHLCLLSACALSAFHVPLLAYGVVWKTSSSLALSAYGALSVLFCTRRLARGANLVRLFPYVCEGLLLLGMWWDLMRAIRLAY